MSKQEHYVHKKTGARVFKILELEQDAERWYVADKTSLVNSKSVHGDMIPFMGY